MKAMKVYNRTATPLTLMLEPIGNYFEIPPESHVSIVGDFKEGDEDHGVVDIHSDCFVVWTSLDAVVFHNGKTLRPQDS